MLIVESVVHYLLY